MKTARLAFLLFLFPALAPAQSWDIRSNIGRLWIRPGSSPPVVASTREGEFWYDSATHAPKYWNASSWTAVGGSTSFSDIAASPYPDANNTRDLGTNAKRWRTGYYGTGVHTPALEAADGTAVATMADTSGAIRFSKAAEFAAGLTGTTAVMSGAVSGTTWTGTGPIHGHSANITGNVTASADVYAVGGTFSGAVSGTTWTGTGLIHGHGADITGATSSSTSLWAPDGYFSDDLQVDDNATVKGALVLGTAAAGAHGSVWGKIAAAGTMASFNDSVETGGGDTSGRWYVYSNGTEADSDVMMGFWDSDDQAYRTFGWDEGTGGFASSIAIGHLSGSTWANIYSDGTYSSLRQGTTPVFGWGTNFATVAYQLATKGIGIGVAGATAPTGNILAFADIGTPWTDPGSSVGGIEYDNDTETFGFLADDSATDMAVLSAGGLRVTSAAAGTMLQLDDGQEGGARMYFASTRGGATDIDFGWYGNDDDEAVSIVWDDSDDRFEITGGGMSMPGNLAVEGAYGINLTYGVHIGSASVSSAGKAVYFCDYGTLATDSAANTSLIEYESTGDLFALCGYSNNWSGLIQGAQWLSGVQAASSSWTVGTTETCLVYTLSASNYTVTLPAVSTTAGAAGYTGRRLTIKCANTDADNTVTVDGNGGEHIDGEDTVVLSPTANLEALTIVSTGTGWTVEEHYGKD